MQRAALKRSLERCEGVLWEGENGDADLCSGRGQTERGESISGPTAASTDFSWSIVGKGKMFVKAEIKYLRSR